jgi:hypothetical protein
MQAKDLAVQIIENLKIDNDQHSTFSKKSQNAKKPGK